LESTDKFTDEFNNLIDDRNERIRCFIGRGNKICVNAVGMCCMGRRRQHIHKGSRVFWRRAFVSHMRATGFPGLGASGEGIAKVRVAKDTMAKSAIFRGENMVVV
jgi:hypothetical protein